MVSSFEDWVDGTRAYSQRTFTQEADIVGPLREVSALMDRLTDRFGVDGDEASQFAMAHAAFLSAMDLATSGQLPPSYMVMRGCLEDALYGFYLHHHPELLNVWYSRHEGAMGKKQVRDAFKIGRMLKFLSQQDDAIALRVSRTYENAIDQGAHPNALALAAHVHESEDGALAWQYISNSKTNLRLALFALGITGAAAIELFALGYPTMFADVDGAASLNQIHSALHRVGSEIARGA